MNISRGASVRRACTFLEQRLAEKVTLAELAEHVGIGRASVIRSFKAQLGITPFEYLLRIRLARAVDLLGTGMSGAAVACEVGFCDQSLLCRQFRRIYGVTPGTFARTTRQRPAVSRGRGGTSACSSLPEERLVREEGPHGNELVREEARLDRG